MSAEPVESVEVVKMNIPRGKSIYPQEPATRRGAVNSEIKPQMKRVSGKEREG